MSRWEGAEVLMGDEGERPELRVWTRAELDRMLYGEKQATKGRRSRATMRRTEEERRRSRHNDRDEEGRFK
jgi:hypothetical protein